jgi:Raf kinase inhibitor-like YbhB/YbcL family protein
MEEATRRSFLVTVGAAGVVVSGCVGGDDGDAPEVPEDSEGSLSVSSLAFEDGGEIPTEYTCDGANNSPPLRIEGVPEEAETLALIVDDPDAPDQTFVHWLLWNIPADTEQIPQSMPQGPAISELGGAEQGTNDNNDVGYFGPCPPEEDGPHTYRFILYAVDTELELEAGATRDELDAALDGRTVGTGRLDGTYER